MGFALVVHTAGNRRQHGAIRRAEGRPRGRYRHGYLHGRRLKVRLILMLAVVGIVLYCTVALMAALAVGFLADWAAHQ